MGLFAIPGRQLDGARAIAELRDRAGCEQPGEVVGSSKEPRVQSQGVVEVGNRPVESSREGPGVAALAERLGVLGIEPDGLVEVADRFFEVAPGDPGGAAAPEGRGALRIEPDRLIRIGNRLSDIAQPRLRQGATRIELGEFRGQFNRLIEIPEGVLIVPE